MSITPFTISISDASIADLKQRLSQTRFPEAVSNDFTHG